MVATRVIVRRCLGRVFGSSKSNHSKYIFSFVMSLPANRDRRSGLNSAETSFGQPCSPALLILLIPSSNSFEMSSFQRASMSSMPSQCPCVARSHRPNNSYRSRSWGVIGRNVPDLRVGMPRSNGLACASLADFFSPEKDVLRATAFSIRSLIRAASNSGDASR